MNPSSTSSLVINPSVGEEELLNSSKPTPSSHTLLRLLQLSLLVAKPRHDISPNRSYPVLIITGLLGSSLFTSSTNDGNWDVVSVRYCWNFWSPFQLQSNTDPKLTISVANNLLSFWAVIGE